MINTEAVADFLVNSYPDSEDPVAELIEVSDIDRNLAKKIIAAWQKIDVMTRHKMGFKEKDMLQWVNKLAGKHESIGRVANLKNILEVNPSLGDYVKVIKKQGMILDLKKPISWKGVEYKQIMTDGIEKSGGKYRINSRDFDTSWEDSVEDLTKLIDWDKFKKRSKF